MKHFAWNDLRDIVTVQGRTWEHEDNLYFNWSSSGFTVRFRGSALLAEFSAQSSEEYDGIPGDPNTPHRTVWPWISVFVDDNDQPCRTFELTNKSTKYLIYSGTDEQEHTVRVVKLTENIKTGLSLHSFDVDGEILMPVVEPIKKRIEFVGDSITCGFGLGTSEKDRFYYPQEENVWMAHGPTAARCLGMDWQMICISGICLAPRKEIPMPVAMNMLYEYTDRPAQQALELDADHWNFKEHPVDYVVINLGTNDATAASFSAAPKKIEEQYEKDYVHFLKTVRKCNGDKTKIICALGSMDYYFYDAMNRAVDTQGYFQEGTFLLPSESPARPVYRLYRPFRVSERPGGQKPSAGGRGNRPHCPANLPLGAGRTRPELYPAQAGRTEGALPYMVEPGTGLPQCPH